MSNYIEFINKLDLYCQLLELEELISGYQVSCINNRDQDCFHNLKSSLDKYVKEYQDILKNNDYKSRDELKKNLLDIWSNNQIGESLSEFYIIKNENYKSIYGLIEEIVSKDLDFSHIYLFLIDHGLYDPNVACGISHEPFYTLLPVNNIIMFKDANKKVIMDSRTDFHLLRNGTDIFDYVCYFYNQATNITEKDYWRCYLLWMLQSNLSIFDSLRFQSVDKKISWEYEPLVYQIFSNDKLCFLMDYLCSSEGILRQYKNAKYPSDTQKKAIDFYIDELDKRGIYNPHILDLKKLLS